MFARQQRIRRIRRTSVPLPVSKKTPTLRLGPMLQTGCQQSRSSPSDCPSPLPESDLRPQPESDPPPLPERNPPPERDPVPLSSSELDALGRIPRRRAPLLVFTALVTLVVLGAATWPKAKVLFERMATMSVASAKQTLVVASVNAAIVESASAGPSDTDKTAIEIAPDKPRSALPSQVQVEPSADAITAIPRRPRHSEPIPRSRSIPLRGYAWSPTANSLVQIEP